MIASLPLPCGLNIGGIRHLQIVAVADVESIMAPINSVVTSAIVLKGSATMAVLEFPSFSADFTENEKDTEAGVILQPRIRVSIPKDAPEIGDWANSNLEAEVIALYMDENRVARIVGDLQRPLTLRVNFSTGKRAGDSNDYDLVLDGISDHHAYYYQMFQVASPGNRRVYSAGYTFGYQRT